MSLAAFSEEPEASRLDVAVANFKPAFREFQRETVDRVISYFEEGRRVVLVQAPVGSGKSLVNYAVARAYPRTVIATPQRSLVDQMVADPHVGGLGVLRALKGRGNYPCPLETRHEQQTVFGARHKEAPTVEVTAANARCTRKPGWSKSQHFHNFCEQHCTYLTARREAQESDVALTTFQFLLLERGHVFGPMQGPDPGFVEGNLSADDDKLGEIDLLIIDEAHGIEPITSSVAELKFAEYTVHGWDDLVKERPMRPRDAKGLPTPHYDPHDALYHYEWLKREILPVLKERLGEDLKLLEEGDERPPRNKGEWETRNRKTKAVQNLMTLIGRAERLEDLRQSPQSWIVEHRTEDFWGRSERTVLAFRPVLVGRILQRELWWRAKRILLTSGTILKPESYLRDVGLAGKDWAFVDVPMAIPPRQRPISYQPAGKMTRTEREKTLDKMLDQLDRIIEDNPERGIVHTHSYAIAEKVGGLFGGRNADRLIMHTREDREEKLREFKASGDGKVLISVAMAEGIDLPDDAARWAVVTKVPFPYLGDPVVKARMAAPGGQLWYSTQTARTLQQMVGRHVRGPNDWGKTFILDASFEGFYRRNRDLFLPWFREGLLAGGFVA